MNHTELGTYIQRERERDLAYLQNVATLEQIPPTLANFILRRAPDGSCYTPDQAARVLIVGGAFVDVTLGLDHVPTVGGDSYAKELNVGIGGCALNVAHILKQLAIPMELKVPVGNGPYASIVDKQLRADGYTPLIESNEHDCGYCLCLVDRNGERTFVVVPGVENYFQKEWMQDIALENTDLIYISGFDITEGNGEVYLEHYANKRADTVVFFDAGARVDFITQESWQRLLSLTPILHLNRLELSLITGIIELEEALQKLESMSDSLVILSLDAQGCLLSYHGERYHHRITPVQVVDATGAGDSHTAGIIAGLASGMTLPHAIELGSMFSAQAVTMLGARLNFANAQAMHAKLRQVQA